MSEIDARKIQLGKAIGLIPSGVFILTAHHESNVHSMLASWVQQASFDPPAIAISVSRKRQIALAIRESKRFALSILWEKNTALMKHFAKPLKGNKDPFIGLRVINTPGGLPVMADSLAWLECRVISACDFEGDHDLFVGEIVAGAPLRQGKPFTHVRKNGFNY